MKSKILIFIALLMTSYGINAQVFWSEGFGSTCAQNNLANGQVTANGTWTVTSTGFNGAQPNKWFISSTESGMGSGNCGNGCLGTGPSNQTLHVGNDGQGWWACFFCGTGDCGAAYADGTSDFGFCAGSGDPTMNARAESPTIDCSGQTGITLAFDYITLGQPGVDYCEARYFDGVVWSSLGVPPTTTACGGGQHTWETYTVALPASANNNPNVKIGFRWYQVTDDLGADPSFAADNVQLSVVLLPVELGDFYGIVNKQKNDLHWETHSEVNSSHFEIERRGIENKFEVIGLEGAASNAQELIKYDFEDRTAPLGMSYYRLKQVDLDGEYTYSQTIALSRTESDLISVIYPNPAESQITIQYQSKTAAPMKIIISDLMGREVMVTTTESRPGTNSVNLNVESLLKGQYLVNLLSDHEVSAMHFEKL